MIAVGVNSTSKLDGGKIVLILFEKIKTRFACFIAGSIVFVCMLFFESKHIGDGIYKNNMLHLEVFKF